MCYGNHYKVRNFLKTMPHYICTGSCGGVSDNPSVCTTEGCTKEGQSLKPCECTDGEHAGLSEIEEIEEEQEERE